MSDTVTYVQGTVQMAIDNNLKLQDTCPQCQQKYENIGHPLKPGVIMMRTCGCKYEIAQQSQGTTIYTLTPPEK